MRQLAVESGFVPPRAEFAVHMLNETGKASARTVAARFSALLDGLEATCGKEGRDMAIVRTKLEEACFFAKRALASKPENQEAAK